jgi:hypothetical protein
MRAPNDDTELCEALRDRCAPEYIDGKPTATAWECTLMDSAARIEALAAQLARSSSAWGAMNERQAAEWRRAEAAEARVAELERERDALYRFARLNGHMAIDIQNAIDAAKGKA